jgi:hypothetical protein
LKRRHTKTVLGLFVVSILIGTSIVPAFSPNLKDTINECIEKKVESYITDRFNETNLEYPWSYENIIDLNLRYEEIRKYGKYWKKLIERYIHYSYVDHLYDYQEYMEYHERTMEEYYEDIPKKLDNHFSEKPDFENGKTWYVDDDGNADFMKIQE